MRTKYVKIERGEGFKGTYTTERVAKDAMARGLATAYKPVTLKEIKAERLHHLREEDYFRHLAEDEYMRAHNGRRCKATIISGGKGDVEFLARVEGLEHLQVIYACNIKGTKTWYESTACVYYKEGEVVDVELKVFHDFKTFVCGLTPGHFDAEKWARLDKDRLAFKCDENGKALNGLFAERRAGTK